MIINKIQKTMKNKKTTKLLAYTFSTIITLSMFSMFAFAATDYVPLEQGAFSKLGVSDTSNLSDFLSKIFSFGIAIAVALAVVYTAWGGIQYMTTDSWTGKEDGKERIKNAFYGLALAFISWLILYTINPNLVNFANNQIVNVK